MLRNTFFAMLLLAPAHAALSQDKPINWLTFADSVVFVTATTTEPTGAVTSETGTGFILTPSGYVITANHIIGPDPSTKISVRIGSRAVGPDIDVQRVPAPIFGDVALLQLPSSPKAYKSVKFHNPWALSILDHLEAAGFPLTSDYSVVDGTISNLSSRQGFWQVSIPLNYGNSGGPVFDKQGAVVGMVEGGIRGAQQINYIIPLNLLSPYLNMAGIAWPPYPQPEGTGALVSAPDFHTPVLPSVHDLSNAGGASNCHEISVISMGLPPRYERKTVCD
ncbi:serine protease [Paraburkholderia fungorum]|uniref:S1 family peptidase n=1 Tax=Paraburkholderia fungorum TaxID=134537 RepID=UPI0038B96112